MSFLPRKSEAAKAPINEGGSGPGMLEVAASAEPATTSPSGALLRDRIYEHIKGQLRGAEQVVLSTKAIADAIGANASNVTYHLDRLVKSGQITTQSTGPKGTRFRLGTGTSTLTVVRAGRGRKDQGSSPAAPSKKTGLNFCPYCGEKLAVANWRFCGYCGEKLN